MRIVLARHGETEWSASGKHTSTTDIPLTDRGREAARGAARAAGGAATSRSCSRSPRARARETAQLAGFDPEIDPDLAEVDYGDYEGLTTPRDPRGPARAGRSGPTARRAARRSPRPARGWTA